MPNFDRTLNWYAVHTRSNFEQTVTQALQMRGIEAWCPAFEETHQWADRNKLISRPVFPGYVFTRIENSAEQRLEVLKSRGALRILGIASEIEPVPNEQVDSIRRMLSAGSPCYPSPFLREGARVTVRRGHLKGVLGILIRIKNRSRLVLSVELLQQSVAIDIDVRDVEVFSDGIAVSARAK